MKTRPTPLVTAFALVTAILGAVLVYQQFSPFKIIDFGPMVGWLMVAVPAGIFGSIYLQVRAAQRTEAAAQQVHTRIAQLEAEARMPMDVRRAPKPNLNSPLPEKDPFENL